MLPSYTFHKIGFLDYKLFGVSLEVVCPIQEFSVLNLAQQTPGSTFTFQFSFMHPGLSGELSTQDCVAGVRCKFSS